MSAVLEKPIVYGTIAFWLGKKAEESKSHRWTCYLRSNRPDEDLGLFVRKVVFTLHPSFNPPTRTVEKAPFDVTEFGWGEFDISATIHFVDPTETPVELLIPLRLYPDTGEQLVPKRAVVAERYDELVFVNPSETLHQRLLQSDKPGSGWSNHVLAEHWASFDTAREAQQLGALREKVGGMLDTAQTRKADLEAELKGLHAEISHLENKMR
ncbi:yeats family-domain-containing protein [Pavlovales sp. CCMP2436]|nr:yeats family-domain-containing protein [Pavlovales sp. CCMP2436]|mmetsp:Transcript_15478/g.39288  ORF Transcript_15478/g.39288 Transcript_15478/m.39288 type:complete len:211 (+) Transcript_15478:112-744(+)